MHFTLVVFSESPDDLVHMLAPFGNDRFDYYNLEESGWIADIFHSKYSGVPTNRGFASELHFGATSNRLVAEQISILPGYIMSKYTVKERSAAVSCMLRCMPYAFVTPDGDWLDSNDVGAITFHDYYKKVVGDAKRHNYHVTAVDCHI